MVERVARPVLMIAARESQLWPCEHAETAIAANPLGRAVIIEDSGHTISFDQLDGFHEVLFDFLRDTDMGPGLLHAGAMTKPAAPGSRPST